jgi:uncharacterized membrane protein SirB2
MPMDAAAFYPLLRHAHLTLAAASVVLFAVRGAAVLAGRGWPARPALRVTSVAIDTLLLSAGAALWWMLGLHPAHDTWLAAKLAWLVAYIVAGSFALKHARSRRGRAVAYAAALVCVAFAATIALAHRPAGALAPLLP